MYEILILDTGPLSNCVVSLATPRQSPTPSQQCRQWMYDCELAGRKILVPAIAYYEVLRELELRQATGQIKRLKEFCLDPGRFISLTTGHLEAAAQLWAAVRKSGRPTADRHSLDADLILAAQALSLGLEAETYVIVSTNPAHIGRFAPCDLWSNITP